MSGGRYPSSMTTEQRPRRGRPRTTAQTDAPDDAATDQAAKSNPRRDLVEKQIMEHAIRLFAERGFASTTLQDIADATGLTRPALYHYVANKDELLSRLVSEIAEEPAALLREINAKTALTAGQKLREMATEIALHQAKQPERFRLIIRSEAELPESLSKVYLHSRRHVLQEFMLAIDEGISAGQLRPVDPRVAALAIIGMLNWIAWWHHPGNIDADRAIASQLADMAVASLAQQDGRTTEPEGPARAIDLIRQDLKYLERLLEHRKNQTRKEPNE